VASSPIGQPETTRRMNEAIRTVLKVATGDEVELRIQAYNVLRTLFKNNNLGEAGIAVFAGEGLAIALKGFQSNNWAVRMTMNANEGERTFFCRREMRQVCSSARW